MENGISQIFLPYPDKYVIYPGMSTPLSRHDKFGFSTRNSPKLYEKRQETLRDKLFPLQKALFHAG